MAQNSDLDYWYIWTLPPLWQKRWLILRIAALGLASSVLFAFCIPSRYTSAVRLMPPDAQSRSGLAMMASALSGVSAPIATGGIASLVNSRSPDAVFLAILASRTVQDDLINRFDLRKVYDCKLYLYARKTLANRTGIDEDKKTGVVTISVTDNNPERARELAAGYVDELNKLVVVMDTSSAHRERVFLEQRLQSVKHDLDMASDQLSHFSSENATMDVQHQASVMLDATARLQGELIAAESQLSGLEAIYSPDNARVRSVRARVETLKQQLQKMGGSNQTSSNSMEANQLYPSLRQLPLLGVTYSDLYRKVTIEETVYETLTKQYELAKVEEAKEIPTVTILDPPNLPEKRSFPSRILLIASGTFLTLFATVGWIVVQDRWQVTDESHPVKAALRELTRRARQTSDSSTVKVAS